MTSEVLSQLEVESLLGATGGGRELPAADPLGKIPSDHDHEYMVPDMVPVGREEVIPYDFKRPERVGKEQIQALQMLHEGFGRNFGAALSGLLRSIVGVKLAGVDQLTYSEFLAGLESPSCFNLLKAEPLEGNLILDINPSILYPIIDRLLGGGQEPGALARRPLTEIELRLVSRITGLVLEELRHAWENVLDLKLAVLQVQSNPRLVEVVPPNEVIVVIGFELSIGELRGMMKLCIPGNSIERIGGKLSAGNWVSYGRKNVSQETIRQISQTICNSPVGVQVRLAQTRIGTGELMSLRVGDIITTQKDVHQSVIVSVEGVPKFRAKLGVFKGRKAIMIQNAIENPLDALGE